MSSSVNKVILIGHLGRDPELRYTPNGSPVMNISIATNEAWTDKSGERQERTEWHKVVIWGRQAEVLNEYLRKGKQIYVEGSLQTRQYEDKDNITRYITEVRAQQVKMLGRPGDRVDFDKEPPQESGGPEESKVEEPKVEENDLPF